MSEVKTITQFYKAILKQDEDVQELFELQNQYHHLFQFDPITFENLPSTLDAVIDKNIEYHKNISKKQPIHDYLYRIFLFAEPAFKHIFSVLKNNILREHTMLPISKVREIDGKSISWLNKRPGRTIKQKIGGAGKIFAPHRIISIDTAENRLLKAAAYKLNRLLSAQQKASGVYSVKIKFIQRWLQSEDAGFIGEWNNIPPNNVLLSDKNYKKIWKTWIELQRIDSLITEYLEHIEEIKKTIHNINLLTLQYQKVNSHIIQRPVLGDKKVNLTTPFKDYQYIVPYPALPYKKINLKNYADSFQKNYEPKIEPIKGAFCVIDLTSIKPNFSFCQDEIRQLPFILLQQIWKYHEKKSDKITNQFVDCGNAQAILLNSEDKNIKIDTFSFHDSLNQDVNTDSFKINDITGVLIKKLSSYLLCSKLIYFLPESLDDFSSQIIRANINLYFFNAEQLPRSIAKIMLHFNGSDENTIDTEKYYIVREETDSEVIYTPIKAIKDKSSDFELKKLIKNHNGVIWERHPSIIERKKTQNKKQDENQFIDTVPLSDREFLPKIKKNSNDIEFLKIVLNTDNNEKKSYIPPKSLEKYPHDIIIELNKNDVIQGGVLFTQNKQILENEKIDIPLWKDHLPPLKLKTFEKEIQLVNDYTSIIPKRGHAVIIDVEEKFTLPKNSPFIEFELERGAGQQQNKFFSYIKNQYFPLQEDIDCDLHLTYTYGDNKPYKLSFIPRNNIQKQKYEAFIVEWTTETHIDINSLPIPNYPPIYKWDDFFEYPESEKEKNDDIIKWWSDQFDLIKRLADNSLNRRCNLKIKRNRLRFCTFTICNNGMSILNNREIDNNFKHEFKNTIRYAEIIIKKFRNKYLQDEMRLFLSALHKDTPESNIQFLIESCKNNFNEYYRNIAFALGDLSQQWHKNLFNFILTNYLNEDREEIDYVLRLLSISIWRHKDFVFKFISKQLIVILKIITIITNRLKKNKKYIEEIVFEDPEHDKQFYLNLSFFIELLIGLLRLREKEEYREALSPYSAHIKELYTVLKSLKGFDIKTRMKFKSDDKSEITALEYLMERLIGTIKNSSIKIAGVSAG
ncbi:DUF2357 domain-containing protein [Treponema denticola]|uniref:DUF2357 domain-containing protein n=1 Tax=Treponema denticola TaxID=158 RepID=UPI0020A4CD39|nr:DUF2357 domain-containing protein [Treponema denticola]UTC82223.1 DUF2357 domain-containing protein [Treponema denticola]